MDEHEGGVRTPLLYSLAQPLRFARPRQGGPVPVHRVKGGGALLLVSPGADWTELLESSFL